MNGMWKLKRDGYNIKNIKRKKTTKKHIIKDNINQLRKFLNKNKRNNKNITMEEYSNIYFHDIDSGYIINNKKINLYLIEIEYIKKNELIKDIFKGFFIGNDNKTLIELNSMQEYANLKEINDGYSFLENNTNIKKFNILKDLGYIDLNLNLEEIEDKSFFKFRNKTKFLKYYNINIDDYYVKNILTLFRHESKTNKNMQKVSNRERRSQEKQRIHHMEYDLLNKKESNKSYYYD